MCGSVSGHLLPEGRGGGGGMFGYHKCVRAPFAKDGVRGLSESLLVYLLPEVGLQIQGLY